MNTHIKQLLKSINETRFLEEDDEEIEEELGNTTSAYAGGEGPQRTPYAFGKSDSEKRKKFGRPSAAYSKSHDAPKLFSLKENYLRFFGDFSEHDGIGRKCVKKNQY